MLRDVSILQGTASAHDLSYGNTLPLVARPWAMNHWSLQTQEGGWFFHPAAPKIQGIRCTHQPSPWIEDYGAIVVMPQVGPLAIGPTARSSAYRLADAELQPDYLCVGLLRYQTTVEMTPSERGAIFRLHFPTSGTRRVLVQPVKGDSHVQVVQNQRRIVGYTRGHTAGAPANFAMYFVIECDQPLTQAGTFVDETVSPALEAIGNRAGAWVEFAGAACEVHLRMATSFISIEQAMRNLDSELRGSFSQVRAAAAEAWNQMLSRVEIQTDQSEQRRTFYSCLYRCCLFPRATHEFDASGAMVHYSPFDGQVHSGPMYTDNGFWDTYRTLYPLLCLLDRPRVGQMMEGFLNAYREGGWLPQWCSPGYRGCMIGTHADAVLAHAAACDVKGFDLQTAYEAARHDLTVQSPSRDHGWTTLQQIIEKGYAPHESVAHATSATLDFAYDNYCVAQLARMAGREADATPFLERSGFYRNLFDPATGFFRARTPEGNWVEPFDPLAWGGPYVEGGAWQSTWAVQHDPAGLIELMGGPQATVARLEEMLSLPPDFRVGSYGFEIHEMTEMSLADFGQYAQSNQPVHHVLYLFAAAGRVDRTRQVVHRVLRELYNPSPKGLPGDEDNGEMAAWYVLNALGLFPLCPGDGRYWLGLPLFPRATLRPADAAPLEITCDATPEDPQIEVSFRGQAVTDSAIAFADLAMGGSLSFVRRA